MRLKARYRREHAASAPVDHSESIVEIPSGSAALLLIDVYPREGQEASIVRTAIAPAKAAARRADIPVVYVTNHLADSTTFDSEFRKLWLRTLGEDVLETWSEPSNALSYLPEIAPGEGDLIVRKQHYSGFFETELDSVLRSLDARDLILAGFDARICVSATATDAFARGYRVFVLRDAIATTEAADMPGEDTAYRMALRYIETCVGYSALVADFVEACEARS